MFLWLRNLLSFRNIHLNTFLIRTYIHIFPPLLGFLKLFTAKIAFSHRGKTFCPLHQIQSPSEVSVQACAGIAALAGKPQQENLCPMHAPRKYGQGRVKAVENKTFCLESDWRVSVQPGAVSRCTWKQGKNGKKIVWISGHGHHTLKRFKTS